MTNPNPYQAPEALLAREDRRPSPRARFGIATLCFLLAAPVFVITGANFRFLVLIMCLMLLAGWIGSIIWVLDAHRNLPGIRYRAIRILLVAIGLMLAEAVVFIIGVTVTLGLYVPTIRLLAG